MAEDVEGLFIGDALEVKKGKNTNIVIRDHHTLHTLEPQRHINFISGAHTRAHTHTPIIDIRAQLAPNPKLCMIRKYKPKCKQACDWQIHLSMLQ